jgi:hypothetical protein
VHVVFGRRPVRDGEAGVAAERVAVLRLEVLSTRAEREPNADGDDARAAPTKRVSTLPPRMRAPPASSVTQGPKKQPVGFRQVGGESHTVDHSSQITSA